MTKNISKSIDRVRIFTLLGPQSPDIRFSEYMFNFIDQSYSLRYWLIWNAVMVYNLWVMENLENLKLIENGNKLTVNYSCCETASLQEIDEEKKLRESKKYPTWSQVSSEMPSRKWKPHPVEPLSA